MFRMKQLALAIITLIALTGLLLAQTQPAPNAALKGDAQEILKKAGEAYRNLKTYHFEGVTVVEMKMEGMYMRMEVPIVQAAGKSGQSRLEMRGPFMLRSTTVSDGQTTWTYIGLLNQYTKKPVAASKENDDTNIAAQGLGPGLFGHSPATSLLFAEIADKVKSACLLREEAVNIGGQSVNCYVVEVEYDPASKLFEANSSPKIYWIDKARSIVLRRTSKELPEGSAKESPLAMFGGFDVTETTTISVAWINEPLPDSLFVFTPPAGAKEVEEMGFPGMSAERVNLAGKEAINFTLADFDGKQVELQSLRGKVVLLDFWATWCGPCVRELPHIEKLHREFKDKGLVVLGINNEEPEVARKFIKENGYTFPTLSDPEGEVGELYCVSAIPQVLVISREGKILTHLVGSKDESELRKAVEAALSGETDSKAASS